MTERRKRKLSQIEDTENFYSVEDMTGTRYIGRDCPFAKKAYIKEDFKFNAIAKDVIRLLIKTRCSDNRLAIKIINTYATWSGPNRGYFLEEQEIFLEHCLQGVYEPYQDPVVYENWKFHYGKNIIAPLDIAIRNGDYEFAKCIVKYNASSIMNTTKHFHGFYSPFHAFV